MATMAVVAEEPATPGPAVAGDEVKPYKIHVSGSPPSDAALPAARTHAHTHPHLHAAER